MSNVCFYFVKSKTTYVWSLRIKKRVCVFRLNKTVRFWKPIFITYKLEDLDPLPFYVISFIHLGLESELEALKAEFEQLMGF